MISTKSDKMRAAPKSVDALFQDLTRSLDLTKERLMPNYTIAPAKDKNPRVKRPEERFWPKVDKNGEIPAHNPELGRCWIWKAARGGGRTGQYGRFYDGQGAVPAHRWAWESVNGPIPEGLTIDHLCRVKLCVNPDHLEPVPSSENTRRATRLITHCPYGHPYSKENTYIYPQGWRKCRECHRIRDREYWRKRRGA